MIKNLELYLVQFKKNKSIKIPKYLNNCGMRGDKYYFIIIITYNKCMFSINNRI